VALVAMGGEAVDMTLGAGVEGCKQEVMHEAVQVKDTSLAAKHRPGTFEAQKNSLGMTWQLQPQIFYLNRIWTFPICPSSLPYCPASKCSCLVI